MKKGIIIILLFCNLFALSQNTSSPIESNKIEKEGDNTIYKKVEVPPQFVGGPFAMMLFIKKNTKYPEIARENNVAGTVMIRFVIEKDGSVSNVNQVGFNTTDENNKMSDYGMVASAVSVIKAMPNWQPGKQNGVAVRSQVVIPVIFKLD